MHVFTTSSFPLMPLILAILIKLISNLSNLRFSNNQIGDSGTAIIIQKHAMNIKAMLTKKYKS